MTGGFLLDQADLPAGFRYPSPFLRVVDLGLHDLEPWWLLSGDALLIRRQGLADRYPQRDLVPFARRQDNDDVACWEGVGPEVQVVHDYASAGWEQRATLPSFEEWFVQAAWDMFAFE